MTDGFFESPGPMRAGNKRQSISQRLYSFNFETRAKTNRIDRYIYLVVDFIDIVHISCLQYIVVRYGSIKGPVHISVDGKVDRMLFKNGAPAFIYKILYSVFVWQIFAADKTDIFYFTAYFM